MFNNFNPFSWLDRLNKGEYRESTESTPNTALALPANAFLQSNVYPVNNPQKRYYERLSLVRKFFDVIQTRRQLISQLNDLGKSPVARLVSNAYLREGFYANESMELFTATYIGTAKKKEIQKHMDALIETHNVHIFLRKLLPNFLRLGESLVQPVYRKGEGLVELLDNPRLEDILPIYRGGKLQCFYKLTANAQVPVERYEANYFAHLVMPSEPIKVEVKLNLKGYTEVYNIPEYLEVGRSIFIDAIDLIKRLDMLEVSNLALALRKVLMPMLLAVGVPAGSTTNDILSLTKEVEQRIEDIFAEAGNLGGNFTVSDLLNLSSRVRAIPQFADGKGNLSLLDIGNDKEPNTEETSNIKKEIALLTSTPFQFLDSINLEGIDRQTLLKNFASFTRNLCDIRFATSSFLKPIFIQDLKYKGYEVKPNEISIGYKQMVNVDLLETTELYVGSATSIQEIINAVNGIATIEGSELELDWNNVLAMVDGVLENIPNGKGLLRKKKKVTLQVPPLEVPPVTNQTPTSQEDTPTQDYTEDDHNPDVFTFEDED